MRAGDPPDGCSAAVFCLSRMAKRIAASRTTLVPHGRMRLKNRHL